MKTRFIGLCFIFINFLNGNSQIITDTIFPVPYLIKNILLGDGATINNISYKGNRASIGFFENHYDAFPFREGIILSTGNIYDAQGPNEKPNCSGQMKTKGFSPLENGRDKKSFDAAIVEFDFIPDYDSIRFRFIFASEEYPEYVNSPFNDVFAFYISGKGIEGVKNIATIPGTTDLISVNNINSRKNAGLYVSNNLSAENYKSLNYSDLYKPTDLFYLIQFDGMTVPLTISSQVIPGEKYHFIIAIADVSDMNFDSAVMLEAGSFQSKPLAGSLVENLKTELDTNENNLSKRLQGINRMKNGDSLTIVIPVQFAFNSAEIPSSFEDNLGLIASYLNINPLLHLRIEGHTDNIGENEYNKKLSFKRAQEVYNYLVRKNIKNARLSFEGLGEERPIADNATEENRALNRRVEFHFYIPEK